MVPRKLPLELEEEILIRVPSSSLVRFRSVCKEWNIRFNDKRFVNNHLAHARPELMLRTDSKIYSISVNLNNEYPNIKVHELNFDIPGLESKIPQDFVHCDGCFFFYDKDKGTTVSNPWLRQARLFVSDNKPFHLCGIGYDNSRSEKVYKIVGYTICWRNRNAYRSFSIYDFATNARKCIDDDYYREKFIIAQKLHFRNVSLYGNLYWTAYNSETREYLIRILDVSKDIVKTFCVLPCKKKDSTHFIALAVFKRDQFSLLEQCIETRKVEVWVTKKKITNGNDGEAVVWIKFMSFSIHHFPSLSHQRLSHWVDENIYGKSFVCCSDQTKDVWVYIVREDKYIMIKIDDVVCNIKRCFVYVPSLISIH